MDTNEFSLICKKLDEINGHILELQNRMDRLEGKTNDIHRYVPFVGWLENIGHKIKNKIPFIKNEEMPMLQNDDKLI